MIHPIALVWTQAAADVNDGIIAGIGVLVICLTVATGEAVSVLGLPAVPPTVLTGWGAFVSGWRRAPTR